MAETPTREPAAEPAAPPEPPPPWPLGMDYFFAVLGSWLVPGAGHWMLGHRKRAVLLGAAILGLFWLGQGLAGLRAVNRHIHPIFFCGQVGNGASALMSNRLWARPMDNRDLPPESDRNLPPHLTTGILFTTVSGLLNVLLILHVADPRSWTQRPSQRSPAAAAGRRSGR